MNVVIYARYSSHSQTEQSIEGQLQTDIFPGGDHPDAVLFQLGLVDGAVVAVPGEEPQGRLYEYKPKILEEDKDMRRFVEMCFDPASPMNDRLQGPAITDAQSPGKVGLHPARTGLHQPGTD